MTEPPNLGVPPEMYVLTGGLGLDASESDIRRALADPTALVIEWETARMSWLMSPRARVILRGKGFGGDVRDIELGFYYLKVSHMMKEWREINEVAKSYERGQGNINRIKRNPQ